MGTTQMPGKLIVEKAMNTRLKILAGRRTGAGIAGRATGLTAGIINEGHGRMARRNSAVVLALCSWAIKELREIENRAKDEVDCQYADEQISGVYNDTVISTTKRVSRKPELKILDEPGFVAFVAQHWPTEIVQSVRPAFLEELRNRALDVGCVLGPDGEVCDAAELAEPVEYVATYLKKTAVEVLGPLLDTPLSKLPKLIEETELGEK